MLRMIVLFLVVLLGMWPASAAERIALLIGNQSYNNKVGPLKNPLNDVALLGKALRSLKFKVTEIKDADYRLIDTSINRHIQNVRLAGEGTMSIVYYAGHGAANPDTKINYLIPLDVPNADDEDLWTNSINLNKIVESLREQSPAATHYVIFDACRNELNLTRKGQRALGERGFVPIAYTPGVMIAYATAPGKTATDAGVYAKALAEEIVKPGVEAVSMFRRAALRVKHEIGQDPWLAASTLPENYFAGSKSDEMKIWESVKDTDDPAKISTYLEIYPNGDFVLIAKALIAHHEKQLKAEQAVKEQERRREEVARKAEEVQRLEEQLRLREAALAQQQKLLKEGKDSIAAQVLQDRQKENERLRAEELAKLREEARLAREAAQAADKQRIESDKSAKEARAAVDKAKISTKSLIPAKNTDGGGGSSCSSERRVCRWNCQNKGRPPEHCESFCSGSHARCLQTGIFSKAEGPPTSGLARR